MIKYGFTRRKQRKDCHVNSCTIGTDHIALLKNALLSITNYERASCLSPCDAIRIKPYFSSDLRPSNTLEGTSANSGPAIPDEELPADSFNDYHSIKHTRDSQHEPAASDTQDSPDTLHNIVQILKHRMRKGKKQILVKWEGYGPEHNSWVDETDVVQTNIN